MDWLDKEAFIRFVSTFLERTDRDHVQQFQFIAKKYEMTDDEQENWKHGGIP